MFQYGSWNSSKPHRKSPPFSRLSATTAGMEEQAGPGDWRRTTWEDGDLLRGPRRKAAVEDQSLEPERRLSSRKTATHYVTLVNLSARFGEDGPVAAGH